MKDEILVWKDGRWLWSCEDVPEHMVSAYYARIRIGCHWTDKQVSQFVDQYVIEFLSDE